MLKLHKCMVGILIFACVLLFVLLLFFCLNRNEAKVGTDIEFVQKQFPCIEEIEEVKYYYDVKSNEREIGLSNIEFDGFIKIGEKFCCKITQEYDWKETKKAKKIIPKKILVQKSNLEYNFLYSYDFSSDGKYISDSWVGDFYLDKSHRVLYFECEW